ncbi:MAG: L-glutamate gamma-semialdehyde dehydrogenase [Bacteroidetes bacterium]|nr:L-glutamate gamma-semialdehyde dehydrogenase [Bacteroidota bacterium]
MNNSKPIIPKAINEPVLDYAPGSSECASIKLKLKELKGTQTEIPAFIHGKAVHTGDLGEIRPPHEVAHLLGAVHKCGSKQVQQAIESALEARKTWSEMDFIDRASIFLKAADLLAGPWRDVLNASTMLGQSKNVFQAEIDAACELIDFFRFNVEYASKIYEEQPYSSPGVWNRLEYRPLEGFVFAVTPFNFTSITGNLPTAPALMGNTVIWKPASTSIYSAYFIYKLLEEAGLPPGVINMVPGSGANIGDPVLASSSFSGLHFTGSTDTFQHMWRTIGANISNYDTYPRIVGETGGKDFILAHSSADPDAVATAIVRGAFEYQGQKCSAASRIYLPKSKWSLIRNALIGQLDEIKMGTVEDFSNFVNAVIDQSSYQNIVGYIKEAQHSTDAEIVAGGYYNDKHGYFIEPTVILASDPHYRTMCEEIFGPVVTIFVYDDEKFDETLTLLDQTSPYALTGAVFAQDRQIIVQACNALRNSAGNFYINDKPTGAVVGQQPFGGARASGTNDKAGAPPNLMRWVSARTIKETFNPPRHFSYPFIKSD